MAGPLEKLSEKFRRHGRGETAGLPFNPVVPEGEVLVQVPVEQIEPDPEQPRRDVGDLTELQESIQAVGIIQPIIISVVGPERYRIIAGERRYTAARLLGLPTVPAILRDLEAHHRLEVQIIENLQRRNLNPLEEADSYQRLITEFGMSQGELARRLGKSRQSLNELLTLTRLAPAIREEYCRLADSVPCAVLVEVAKATPGDHQAALWEQVKAGKATTKQAVRAQRAAGPVTGPGGRQEPEVPPPVRKRTLHVNDATITVQFRNQEATDSALSLALQQALEQTQPPLR